MIVLIFETYIVIRLKNLLIRILGDKLPIYVKYAVLHNVIYNYRILCEDFSKKFTLKSNKLKQIQNSHESFLYV